MPGSPEPRAIRIRRLRRSDVSRMIELFRTCGLRPRIRGRDRPVAIARQLRSSRSVYLGAFDAERLIGTILGTHDGRKGWMNRLAVHPQYRRRGIASRLVHECERRLRRQGIEMFAALIETGNRASEATFRALGYDILPMRYARKKVRPGV